MMKLSALIFATGLAAGVAGAATDDEFIYRISNGYNNELRGTVSYRIVKVAAGRVEVDVTTDTPSAGLARTEVYTPEGNWLRHPLASHDQLREYEFTQALPVYAPAGDHSGSWSVRVDAVDPATGKRSSVRVDGKVRGSERITVPAGTFDTIKVMRNVYAGDWGAFLRETLIEEVEWYAPALGRAVKIDSKSSWQDISRCTRGVCPWFRGDWNIFELAQTGNAKP